jgi:glucokinase
MKERITPVGRPSLLRHTNALTILGVLRKVGSCSRADLVRATGMSAPTVTNVVDSLLADDLVLPLGEGESSGGRPPDMIRFKAERGCLLAVQITSRELTFLLADLGGRQLEQSKVPLAARRTDPESVCQLIDLEMRRLLRQRKLARKQLVCLIVGVPAIANVDEGLVLSISTMDHWRSVPLRSLLARTIKCHIVIENDTNLAALGERYRGAAQNQQTFQLINIGDNVSAGIVLDGKLHHGAQWSAGEIGYLRLPNVVRKQPALHEFGELEGLLTFSGILRRWRELGGKGGGRAPADAVEVLDRARSGDSRARRILAQQSRMVADIIVNCSLILNPELMLLAGEIGTHPALLDAVRKELERCEFAVPRIAAATLGESAVTWGAIAMGLEVIPTLLLPLSQT